MGLFKREKTVKYQMRQKMIAIGDDEAIAHGTPRA